MAASDCATATAAAAVPALADDLHRAVDFHVGHARVALQFGNLLRGESSGEAPQRPAVDVVRTKAATALQRLNKAGDAAIEVVPGGGVALRAIVGTIRRREPAEVGGVVEDHDDGDAHAALLGHSDRRKRQEKQGEKSGERSIHCSSPSNEDPDAALRYPHHPLRDRLLSGE